MKYYSLVLSILLLAAQHAIGQVRLPIRKLTYKILMADSVRYTKGYLYDINDTAVKISHWPVRFRNDPAMNDNLKEVTYRQISEITLKRSRGAGRGAWKGAITGLLVGVSVALIGGDHPEKYWFHFGIQEKVATYGVLGAAAGTGIGALIGGLAKKKFIIGGNKEKFDEMKANVLDKVYGK
ncbi:MAG: hypothetical protein H7122_00905 [Chitinophagaceae bacterium]|nr:hypothetical protein [Chitinophagaceae bacterium]